MGVGLYAAWNPKDRRERREENFLGLDRGALLAVCGRLLRMSGALPLLELIPLAQAERDEAIYMAARLSGELRMAEEEKHRLRRANQEALRIIERELRRPHVSREGFLRVKMILAGRLSA
jgi:hypothetical protein